MSILNTSQFRKLDTDPTKSLERKIQWTLRKIKHKLEENKYKKLYATGARTGLFYGTLKVHKRQQHRQQKILEEFTMRPIISDIGMATYEVTKYLSKLLTSFDKSNYNILNTADLIRRFREETTPAVYKMISFNVKVYSLMYL